MDTRRYRMKVFGVCLWLVIVCIVYPSMLYAQRFQQQTLRLNDHTITITANAAEWLSVTRKDLATDPQRQVILHLKHLPNEAERTELEAAGILLQDPVGGNSYITVIDITKVVVIPGILLGISEIDPFWKMDEVVLKASKNSRQSIDIVASFYNVMPVADIKAFISSIGGSVETGDLERVYIVKMTIPGGNIKALAAHYALQYISRSTEPVTLNFESKTASKSNVAALAPVFGGYGLDGSGVTIGVGDNVSGNFHIDLKDRIINYNPASYTDHGVHINGIVGGAGIIDPKGEGVAPGARLVDHFFSGILDRTATFYQQYNMTLTNNSYAAVIRDCKYSGTYDALSVGVDRLALQYPDILHVFASGNDGDMNCTPYPAGFATVSGGYQPAKNNIVVTSTEKNYVNAVSGSRGPVKDGRLKPEITAVGVDVNSTTKTEEYLLGSGTSMATPGVTGGLGLLTQRYKQLHSNANPRADVLKALILNGTFDIGNPGPDYRFGFGFMNLTRSLLMLDSNRYVINTVTNGDQKSFTITVPPNTAQLKVMLCYHDAAATPLAANALVNDLDIEVTEPSATLHNPLVLDTLPANILNNAVEKEDRLNNTEQVTINNPLAGVYTVTIKGYKVPSPGQDYVVSYDMPPVGVSLTYPTTGAAVNASDSLRVYWDASVNSNSFKLEYSTDIGATWNTIDDNIPASERYYRWGVPSTISSGKCLMRISRNGTTQQFTTGTFVISPQPVVSLDAVQCPGYIRINWAGIPGAIAYEVMMKRGPKMQVIGSTAMPTYTISGLSMDSVYYMAVRPVIDGLSGYRSIAINRKPDDGNCSGNISDGDMMLQELQRPHSGRMFTSTELKNNESISVLVRNLDDVPVSSYNIAYRINSGSWQTQTVNTPIAANATAIVTIPGIDLSAIGRYKIDLAVTGLTLPDIVTANDTISRMVKQLNNLPVSLTGGFLDNFENWGVVNTTADSMGISPDDRWDYSNESDTGRIRSFIDPDILVSGNRSVSLDATYNTGGRHGNQFSGTFNMSNYNVATDEVRMEFDYLLHGKPLRQEENYVGVKGIDTQDHQFLYMLNTGVGATGKIANSGSLSVTDALQENGQSFSSSTQITFFQKDRSLISARNYGNGLTIDNVKLYTVQNDIQLLAVVSPAVLECGLTGEVPLRIKVRNGVNQELNNVQLNYVLDGGTVVTETLNSIKGKETMIYDFSKKIDMTGQGGHMLNIWIVANGDTYKNNDSIMNYTFHDQPLITKYPYFEDLENSDGSWYSEGLVNTWQYGTPASPKISKAASGNKAWKTDLTGNYKAFELSYLYSPCFDVSSLSYPRFRFKLAHDIEECGNVFCDGALMQYSADGVNWQRLNDSTKSTIWYTDTTLNIWTGEQTTWHSASVKLPKGLQTVRLRYMFMADMGVEKEGIAIDDLELFDDIPYPAVDDLIGISPNPTRDGNLSLVWTAKGGAKIELVMFNAVGKEVFAHAAVSNEGYNKAMISTPHFASGVYIMRIIIGDKKFSRKIVYL